MRRRFMSSPTPLASTNRIRINTLALGVRLHPHCPGIRRRGSRQKHDQPSSPSFLDALQRAFGLDRNFRVGARRRTSDDADLLVAWLVARHINVFGINLLAEARNLVG